MKDVQSGEELGDVYNHFLLYYGRDIPKMQNVAKLSQKKSKKIKEVDEDGTFKFSYSNLVLYYCSLKEKPLYRIVLHSQESKNQMMRSKRRRKRKSRLKGLT